MLKKAELLLLISMALSIPVIAWSSPQTAQGAARTDVAQVADREILAQMSDICQGFYTGWADIGAYTLYFDKGMPAEGIVTVDGTTMRFRDGVPAPGWERGVMYFDEEGKSVSGLYDIDGTVYLFDASGILMDGIAEYNGHAYCSTAEGIKTGWVDTGDGEEYFLPDGKRAAGITQIDGTAYVLSEDGKRFTAGIHSVSGTEYAVGDNGEMQSGFIQSGQETFYAYAKGGIAKGASVIDGREYLFSQNGALVRNGWADGKYAGNDGQVMKSCVVNGTVLGPDGSEMPNYGYGNGGRLFIPDVGINVSLQYDSLDKYVNQSICNAQDTALFYHACMYECDCIADHKHQGFSAIAGCVPGETMAYILRADGSVSAYRCVGNTEGSNLDATVMSDSGIDIMDHSPYDLQMYTCLEHWSHVKITFWEKIYNVLIS